MAGAGDWNSVSWSPPPGRRVRPTPRCTTAFLEDCELFAASAIATPGCSSTISATTSPRRTRCCSWPISPVASRSSPMGPASSSRPGTTRCDSPARSPAFAAHRQEMHLGLGRGTAKYEYDAFGLDMGQARARFKETWEILDLALSGEPFSYEGEYLDVPKQIRLRPNPRREQINFYGAIGSPGQRGDHGRARPAADLHLDRRPRQASRRAAQLGSRQRPAGRRRLVPDHGRLHRRRQRRGGHEPRRASSSPATCRPRSTTTPRTSPTGRTRPATRRGGRSSPACRRGPSPRASCPGRSGSSSDRPRRSPPSCRASSTSASTISSCSSPPRGYRSRCGGAGLHCSPGRWHHLSRRRSRLIGCHATAP